MYKTRWRHVQTQRLCVLHLLFPIQHLVWKLQTQFVVLVIKMYYLHYSSSTRSICKLFIGKFELHVSLLLKVKTIHQFLQSQLSILLLFTSQCKGDAVSLLGFSGVDLFRGSVLYIWIHLVQRPAAAVHLLCHFIRFNSPKVINFIQRPQGITCVDSLMRI